MAPTLRCVAARCARTPGAPARHPCPRPRVPARAPGLDLPPTRLGLPVPPRRGSPHRRTRGARGCRAGRRRRRSLRRPAVAGPTVRGAAPCTRRPLLPRMRRLRAACGPPLAREVTRPVSRHSADAGTVVATCRALAASFADAPSRDEATARGHAAPAPTPALWARESVAGVGVMTCLGDHGSRCRFVDGTLGSVSRVGSSWRWEIVLAHSGERVSGACGPGCGSVPADVERCAYACSPMPPPCAPCSPRARLAAQISSPAPGMGHVGARRRGRAAAVGARGSRALRPHRRRE